MYIFRVPPSAGSVGTYLASQSSHLNVFFSQEFDALCVLREKRFVRHDLKRETQSERVERKHERFMCWHATPVRGCETHNKCAHRLIDVASACIWTMYVRHIYLKA